ncbi:hypothetical protein BCR32DRAFT_328740, partial [Anaeromyces robustus]
MKFIKSFLSLLTINVVLANVEVIPVSEATLQYGNDECYKEIENSVLLKECTIDLNNTENNYEEICKTVQSDKCKNFMKDPKSAFPNCKDNNTINEIFSADLIDMYNAITTLACQKDENGNLCSMSNKLLKKINISEEDIQITCKSKSCTEAAINVIQTIKDSTDTLEKASFSSGSFTDTEKTGMDEMLKFLTSNQCNLEVYNNYINNNNNNNNNNNDNNNKSDSSSSIKISISFVITLSLLLISIFYLN